MGKEDRDRAWSTGLLETAATGEGYPECAGLPGLDNEALCER